MELRPSCSIRLPGRYRDNKIPNNSSVHRKVSYNPNLPPAVFPTLDKPRPVDTRSAEAMPVPSYLESPDSDSEQETLTKQATFSHGEMQSSNRVSEEQEELFQPRKANKSDKWVPSVGTYDEPREHYGCADDGKSPRIGLKVYEMQRDWTGLTNGLKLLIVIELTAVHAFEEAMKMLILTEEETDEIIYIFDQEIARHAEEDARITRSQAHQLELLMNGTLDTSQEGFSASLEESLYKNLENPVSFIVSKTDIEHAQAFLKSINLGEYGNRLWRYEGIAASSMVLETLGPKIYRLSTEFQEGQVHLDNGEKQTSRNSPIKTLKEARKLLLSKMRPVGRRSVSKSGPLKRHRERSLVLKSKVADSSRDSKPSGLRKSISGDNLEDTVASDPAALQTASSPQRRPAPPPRLREKSAKKPRTPFVRYIKKTLAKRKASKPSSFGNPTQILRTPDRPNSDSDDMGRTRSISERGQPYIPIPSFSSEKTFSPQETPPRGSKKRSTSRKTSEHKSEVRRRARTAGPELLTPSGTHVFGASPAILPEEIWPMPGRASEGSKKGFNFTADAHGGNLWTAPSQQKRKAPEPDESPSKARAQKRMKIQSQATEHKQRSSGRWNGLFDVAGEVPRTDIEMGVTAKFKGIKLLEQRASAPGPK